MRGLMRGLLMLLWMTLLTGIAYPLAITAFARLAMPNRAGGSLVKENGRVIGSTLIGQRFKSPQYFWPRPSAVDYQTLPSGGSNLGPTSARLAKQVAERRKALAEAHGVPLDTSIPEDLLFASASGLDPHISQNAAHFQLERVAKARSWDLARKERAHQIIDSLIEHNPRVFPGEPVVNVLKLNRMIDHE
jgi:potassium-transporting ATPase KdpC subunit